MKFITLSHTVLATATALLLSTAAQAQCPADPLNNTTWSFHAEEADYNFTNVGGASYIGTFKVARTTIARTFAVTGTMTVNTGGGVTRLASIVGSAQLDGQGGTLMFSFGRQSVLWQFVFGNSCSEIDLVSETMGNPSINQVLDGKALRIDNQQPCPANPYLLLDVSSAPTGWSFHTEQGTYQGTPGLSGIGTLIPRFVSNGRDPNARGILTANVTANAGPGLAVYRNAISGGQYQVYGDCSGGTLQFQVGPAAVQYEFVFADGSYNQLFLLSTTLTRQTDNGRYEVLSGYARKNTNLGTAGCPADSLNNTTWAFQAATQDFDNNPSFASVGRFTINRISDPRNVGQQILNLTGTQSVNDNGNLIRFLSIAGKAQLDGFGGTLQFATGSEGTLWQFAFSNDCKEMYMVNEVYLASAGRQRKTAKASAVRIDAPAACPANASLLLDPAFAPTGWTFTTRTATWSGGAGISAIGWLNPAYLINAADPRSRSAMRGIITTNVGGRVRLDGNLVGTSSIFRNASTNGVYQVYPDCTGGNLSMMVGPFITEYEFVFADGAYSQILMVGRAQNSDYNGAVNHILTGTASKY